jgi:hypothetical protein
LGVADLMDDFERETFGFTFKIIPLYQFSKPRLQMGADHAARGLRPSVVGF